VMNMVLDSLMYVLVLYRMKLTMKMLK
jgi:hypothetical protein